MPEYNQLSDGRPDGTQLGQSASDKVAFHGATPTTQISYIATITASATLSQIVVNFNALLDALKTRGLIATS
jgi:hypothetical protein